MLRQLSVFIENNQGSLADLTQALESKGIVIHAMALADASRFGVVRAVVSQPDQALAALQEAGYSGCLTEVMGVKVPDEGEGLTAALKALSELSYKYARSDYSEPSWDGVEQVFMDAQTIIYSAEKKAEIRNVISDAKKKLAKVLTIKAETAKVKAEALKDLKQYTNRKKYKAAGVKIAKAAMKKIRKSADLDEINDLWASAEQKCGKYIKRFRIQVVKKGPGKVSGSKSVKYGGKYTVKLQPKAGKRIKKVYIDGKKKKLRNSYTFKNVKKKHTIKVLFGN